jgi:hypothetical protein
MKHFFIAFSVLLSHSVFSQSSAQAWTKTDCNGNAQTLFSYLDNDQIVIMDFIMLGCASCVTATSYIEQINADYNASHPGKVITFGMSYNNTATCTQMKSWGNSYGFNFQMIPNCASDVAYYGGMGMPTIVVAGGKNHSILYKTIGWKGDSDANIRGFIDQALAQTSVTNLNPDSQIQITHHSTSQSFQIKGLGQSNNEGYFVVTDFSGRIVLKEKLPRNVSDSFSIASGLLKSGLYIATVSDGERITTSKILVSQ